MIKQEAPLMIKVSVNSKKGETTSLIPHRDGTIPVWYKNGNKWPEFVLANKVVFKQ